MERGDRKEQKADIEKDRKRIQKRIENGQNRTIENGDRKE